MGLYGIPIKLFGSCANGIAIKDSDIDIALDNCITNYFNLSEDDDDQTIELLLSPQESSKLGKPLGIR